MVGANASNRFKEAGQLAMMQIILVGIAAGITAALLFALVTSGSIIGTLLFYLASLPILIAAIGWSHLAGLVAAMLAAIGLGLVIDLYFFPAFLLGIGLPAWWLGYLSLLARGVSTNGSGTMEWYPVGRLVFWSAIIASAVVAAAVLSLGTDRDSFQTALRDAFERALRAQSQTFDIPGRPDQRHLLDLLVIALPPAAAVLLTLLNTFNLWLAARIVNVSGRLRRPWPDLTAMTLPGFVPALMAAAMVGSLVLPDILGLLSGAFAASLVIAYAIMGFAVLHAITRGMTGRALTLTGAYAAVVVIGWPILAASMLGLAESTFHIRARFAPKGGPPATRT